VTVCTRGGNQSWQGLVKKLDPSRFDFLFVLVEDGRQWFIPGRHIEGATAIHLGGPKYSEFEVERGDPIPATSSAEVASTIVALASRGDVRVAKGGGL
jgi:ABC-type hemin transport system substrate-binding protein